MELFGAQECSLTSCIVYLCLSSLEVRANVYLVVPTEKPCVSTFNLSMPGSGTSRFKLKSNPLMSSNLLLIITSTYFRGLVLNFLANRAHPITVAFLGDFIDPISDFYEIIEAQFV